MSLAEYGPLTDMEWNVLQIVRALRDAGFVIDGASQEAEARAAARRLAMRKLVQLSIEDAGETARLTSAGFSYLMEKRDGR